MALRCLCPLLCNKRLSGPARAARGARTASQTTRVGLEVHSSAQTPLESLRLHVARQQHATTPAH
eukprot:1147481-Lingulodinium_polyedra.AAC.1